MSNAMDNGEYSGRLISDYGSVLEKEGNSSLRGGFDSGSKKNMFDSGNIAIGRSFSGQSDSIGGKLANDGRSSFLRRSPSNGNSAPSPVFDQFFTTRLTGSQMPDKFIGLDAPRSMPEIVQKPMAFKDEKSRYEDHNTNMLDATIQHYRVVDARPSESRTSINGMVGTSYPPFANTTKGGAQTLEFLFGKAFMKELRSVDAPVSVKPLVSGIFFSNDVSLEGNGMESSFTVPLHPQRSLPKFRI